MKVEPPQLFKHTLLFWRSLSAKANFEPMPGFEDKGSRLFRGKIVELYRELGISQGYYTEIIRFLVDQGCITYIQRGSRGFETVIAVHEPPTLSDWERWKLLPSQGLTEPPDYATLELRIRALETLVGGINIVEALQRVKDELDSKAPNNIKQI